MKSQTNLIIYYSRNLQIGNLYIANRKFLYLNTKYAGITYYIVKCSKVISNNDK